MIQKNHNFILTNIDTYNKKKIRHKTIPKTFLLNCYQKIRQRCTNKKLKRAKEYYGKKFCTKEEFLNKFLENKKFLILYIEWQQKNYEFKFTPSINRINVKGDYSIDNLEFITYSLNSGIDKEKIPVLMYDLNGNFIKEFTSKWEASKELNIPNGNICKVVYGKRKSAGGYVFKFKKT